MSSLARPRGILVLHTAGSLTTPVRSAVRSHNRASLEIDAPAKQTDSILLLHSFDPNAVDLTASNPEHLLPDWHARFGTSEAIAMDEKRLAGPCDFYAFVPQGVPHESKLGTLEFDTRCDGHEKRVIAHRVRFSSKAVEVLSSRVRRMKSTSKLKARIVH